MTGEMVKDRPGVRTSLEVISRRADETLSLLCEIENVIDPIPTGKCTNEADEPKGINRHLEEIAGKLSCVNERLSKILGDLK